MFTRFHTVKCLVVHSEAHLSWSAKSAHGVKWRSEENQKFSKPERERVSDRAIELARERPGGRREEGTEEWRGRTERKIKRFYAMLV